MIRRRIVSVAYVVTEMKQLISSVNAANWHKNEYKCRHEWVGKVILCEVCKR